MKGPNLMQCHCESADGERSNLATMPWSHRWFQTPVHFMVLEPDKLLC